MKRKNDRTGAGGTAIVTAIVNLDMAWIYRPQDQAGTDYGVDAQFEVTDDDGVETGRLVGAQVKAGQSYFREKVPSGFINRPSDRHVQYWRAYGLPVVLVLVDPKTRIVYWAYTANVEQTAGGWKLLVPRDQTLGPDAKAALSAIAVGEGTERTRAKAEEREREEHLESRVQELETVLASYITGLATRPETPAPNAPQPSLDILALPFAELIHWAGHVDFRRAAASPDNRGAFVLAAEHLFFRERIDEHDAAKAVALLLLAQDWGKAASSLLYAVELTRRMNRVESPSIIDFLAEAPLPSEISRDLRIVQRASQIAARRGHKRNVDALLVELDRLIAESEPADGLAVAAAAFWEARAMARTSPDRAMRYTLQAARLRPLATGVGGGPFPSSVDATWLTMLELTAGGIASDEQLAQWLEILDAVPSDARTSYLRDEMNVVALANQFWLAESALPVADRNWRTVQRALARIEIWSTDRTQALLFAAARRAKIVVQGEYEKDLPGAIRMATSVPEFVSADPHATFLLNEIAASQFLYAGQHMEALIAFRGALAARPDNSSILSNSLLKAAQAAAAVDSFDEAVKWSRESVDAAQKDTYRASTDVVVARAEHALAIWFSGDREDALTLWDDVADELLTIEENTDRWRGLMVRFQWADGYLASTYRSGSPPTVDAEGRPYGEARPGAFLIDLAGQAAAFSDKVRFGVLLGLAAISDQRQRDDRTRRWTYAALDLATERIPEWRRVLALLALPPLIADRNFSGALELGRAMGRGLEGDGVANGDLVAMSFSVVPALLAVATAEREQQIDDVRAFHNAIVVAGEDDPSWMACAEVVKSALLSNAGTEERVRRIGETRSADIAALRESPLPMFCDLAASLVPGLPLNACLALHTRAVIELTPRLSKFTTMFRLQVIPFFEHYWQRRSITEPQAFPIPEALRARIEATRTLTSESRLRNILLAVAEELTRD